MVALAIETRPRYSLVVDENVKKPKQTNQPTALSEATAVKKEVEAIIHNLLGNTTSAKIERIHCMPLHMTETEK